MKPLTFICCSVLRRELEEILSREYPDAERVFLTSMLHMHPDKLREAIDSTVKARPDRCCLLVYGDCHAHIQEMERLPHCERTGAVNCGELLLGRQRYLNCRNRKDFLFLPEWTQRWKEVFREELGFTDPSLAREFLQENQTRLVYLDTGLIPVPKATLAEISEYFRMPMEVVAVTLDHLQNTIRSAVSRLEEKASHER